MTIESETATAEPILVALPQAAAMIGRGLTFIYTAIGDGRLRAVKSDGRTLVVVKSLHEYAASLPPAIVKPIPKRPPLSERRKRNGNQVTG
jgi:hypothetical protein